MVALLHAAGGLALIVFGVRSLQAALKLVFGDRLEVWVSRVTSGRFRAASTGALVASMAPSSTTMSLLTLSMVQADRLTTRTAIAVLLGTCVGMTVAIYVVALNLGEHAAVLFVLGLPLSLAHRGSLTSGLGHVVMAIAFIFLGIRILGNGTEVVASTAGMSAALSADSWLLMTVGAVAAVLLQSSTAALALVIGLAVGGVTDLRGSVALVLGANVGVSVTTLLVGLREPRTRRIGVGLIAVRFTVAACALIALQTAGIVGTWTGHEAWAIAATHTAFNVAALVVGLAVLDPLSRVLERVLPDATVVDEDAVTFDDRWVDEPTVAFAQTKREIAAIANRVSRMLDAFWLAMKREDEAACESLEAHEEALDRHYRLTKDFLARQMTTELTTEQAIVRLAHLRFLGDLESVADVIDRNLIPVVRKKVRRGVRFSSNGWNELAQFHELVAENIGLASAAFVTDDVELAERLLRHKKRVRDLEIQLRVRHYERLREGQRDTLETTELHLEILSHLKRINDLVSGVAYTVLEKHGLHTHGRQLIDEARRGQVAAPVALANPGEA